MTDNPRQKWNGKRTKLCPIDLRTADEEGFVSVTSWKKLREESIEFTVPLGFFSD